MMMMKTEKAPKSKRYFSISISIPNAYSLCVKLLHEKFMFINYFCIYVD